MMTLNDLTPLNCEAKETKIKKKNRQSSTITIICTLKYLYFICYLLFLQDENEMKEIMCREEVSTKKMYLQVEA